MHLVKLLLVYFFRRIDYLNRSIYIATFALITRTIELSTREGLSDLVSEVKQLPAIKESWWYWLVRLIEAMLIGGSWFAFGTILFILIALLIIKYQLRPRPQSIHLINQHLRQAKQLMESFKIGTAVQLVDGALESIEDSYADHATQAKLQAHAYFLKGLCRVQNEEGNQAFLNFVKAYELQPSEEQYKERAATSYYQLGRKEEALKLANELFQYNPGNQRANAIKLMLDTHFKVEQVTPSVMQSPTFKRVWASFLLAEKNDTAVSSIFEKELNEYTTPDQITFDNIDYWCLVGRFAYHLGHNNQPNSFTNQKPDYRENKLIQYAHKLLGIVDAAIANTEMLDDSRSMQVASFYFHYSNYLITSDEDSVQQMKVLYQNHLHKLDELSVQAASEIMIAFNQLHRYEDVLEVVSSVNLEKNWQLRLMEFVAFRGLKDVNKSLASFLKYFSHVEEADSEDLDNLFFIVDFLIQESQDIQQFFKAHLQPKAFKNEKDKDLIFCYAHRYLPEFREEIRKQETAIIADYNTRNRNTQYAILGLFHALEDPQKVNQLVLQYHDWQTEEPPRQILTRNLLKLKSSVKLLIELLKFSRENESDEYLMLEELKIHLMSKNVSEILAITTAGRTLFPDNPNFHFYYIQSLYKNKDSAGLEACLNEDLHRINFHWRPKFAIAQVCIEYNKVQLGLELGYREVISRMDSPLIKQHYFILATTLKNRDDIPWPEQVEIDSVVQFSIDGKTQFLRIDQNNVAEHWLARLILGLKAGESKEVHNKAWNRKIQVSIVKIFDKYSGLAAIIMEEVQKPGVSGMEIRSITFDGSDIKTLHQKLIQEFGAEGDIRKIKHDEAFAKYYSGHLTFTELTWTVSGDKLLDIYSYLTSPHSDGFLIVPQRYFSQVIVPEVAEFVIDLTTLPILKKITEDFLELIKTKFIISQFAIEYLENELAEAKSMQEEGMSISITSFGVRPIIDPPGYKQKRVSTLEGILKWIREWCSVEYSNEKLEMALQHPDLVREADLYFNYFIDTVFLSTKRILISDDQAHQTKFRDNYLTLSSEYFLSSQYPESYRENILPLLIANHYIGIKIYKGDLEREYQKLYTGGQSTFEYCLQNLSFPTSENPHIPAEAIEFLRDVYSGGAPLPYKKETARKVLVHLIRGHPHYRRLRTEIESLISHRFEYLPMQREQILDDLRTAEQIAAGRF